MGYIILYTVDVDWQWRTDRVVHDGPREREDPSKMWRIKKTDHHYYRILVFDKTKF